MTLLATGGKTSLHCALLATSVCAHVIFGVIFGKLETLTEKPVVFRHFLRTCKLIHPKITDAKHKKCEIPAINGTPKPPLLGVFLASEASIRTEGPSDWSLESPESEESDMILLRRVSDSLQLQKPPRLRRFWNVCSREAAKKDWRRQFEALFRPNFDAKSSPQRARRPADPLQPPRCDRVFGPRPRSSAVVSLWLTARGSQPSAATGAQKRGRVRGVCRGSAGLALL